jgi:hypothetical protein
MDNIGFRTANCPEQSQPKINATMASQALTCNAGTDTSATVGAGKRYRFSAMKTGGFYFGLATVATGSEANTMWTCPVGATIEIQIPEGYTTLHYTTDTNSAIGRLVEIVT